MCIRDRNKTLISLSQQKVNWIYNTTIVETKHNSVYHWNTSQYFPKTLPGYLFCDSPKSLEGTPVPQQTDCFTRLLSWPQFNGWINHYAVGKCYQNRLTLNNELGQHAVIELATLLLGNQKQTSQRNYYRTLIFLIILDHLQKFSHFWAQMKNTQNIS